MNILISPTAFKGTLSPRQSSHLIATAIKKYHPIWNVVECPVADGGDGTLEVLSTALKGKTIKTKVHGPLGSLVNAEWAISGKTAFIEMARASGLSLLRGKNRIMDATTFGTGELILAALNKGCRNIIIGVGGTATGEGGAGALRALGLRYLDRQGRQLTGAPSNLLKINKIDWSQLDPRLRHTKIFVICDVKNPLLGPRGSARVFGPQKGASPTQVKKLEKALSHWSTFAKFKTKHRPGSGAAGALAFGLSGFLGAKLVAGSPFVFRMLDWKKKAAQADVIITGEGQLDTTSFSGKPIGEIVRHKGRSSVFVVCGRNQLPRFQWRNKISGVFELGKRGLKSPQNELSRAMRSLLAYLTQK